MMNNKDFPVWEVSQLAEKESWRKEINRPIYHIHKWWAQRLGSVFRAILLYLENSEDSVWNRYYREHNYDKTVVLDPFMGSGTTIGEALKLGEKVIGCDINPISSFLVRQELTYVSPETLKDEYVALEQKVADKIHDCYNTIDRVTKEKIPVLYYFWVKIVTTPEGEEIPLFSRYVFAQNAYPSKKPEAQILCPKCWNVFKGKYNQTECICPRCGEKFNPQKGPVNSSVVYGKNGKQYKIKDLIPSDGKLLDEKMYALLAVNKHGEKVYQPVEEYDKLLYKEICSKLTDNKFSLPSYPVKSGYNTDQVRGYNYFYWKDFFNKRQLYGLGLLLDEILNIENISVREQFLCLFSSTLEFNNMFCSYKGEGTGAVRPIFSNHILKPERTPLENSIWGYSNSSGCFSSLFKTRLLKAKEYLDSPFEIKVDTKTQKSKKIIASKPIRPMICNDWEEFSENKHTALILNGDSSHLPIPSKSVDYVVTDPPYFDFIHYSELSDFFYAWLSPVLKDKYGYFCSNTSRRSNEVQQNDAAKFSELLGNVFLESNRVLKNSGKLVFSFHHSKIDGWIAIAQAIMQSNFYVECSFPIHAELMASTPKSSAKSPISLDAIIVCSKKQENAKEANPIETCQSYINMFLSHEKKLSKSDLFVIGCSQCLRKCVADRMDADEMKEYIENIVDLVLKNVNLNHQPICDSVNTANISKFHFDENDQMIF